MTVVAYLRRSGSTMKTSSRPRVYKQASEYEHASSAMPESLEHLSRWRSHLLHRIHRRYHTTVRRHDFNGLAIDFTRIENPDVVLDQVAEEETQRSQRPDKTHGALRLPYWAQLWDSAPGIGQFLTGGRFLDHAGHVFSLRDRDVLDLGCGMGLSGMVAAALGARVLFADLETPPLLFARLNSLPWAARVRTRRMNWQTDRLDERFDLILGADILYE